MRVAERGLDEIVVVGYGEQRKSDVTGASQRKDFVVSTAGEIGKRPLVRVEQALQGTASGVTVSSSERAAGAELNVRIRGATPYTEVPTSRYARDRAMVL